MAIINMEYFIIITSKPNKIDKFNNNICAICLYLHTYCTTN